MQRLTEGRHTSVDIIIRRWDNCAETIVPRGGLRPQDVVCRLKRSGTGAFHVKELSPSTWKDCGHGVYMLSLAPDEFAGCEQLAVVIESQPSLKPAIEPEVLTFDVVEALATGRPSVPQTVLCSHVVTLDQRGKHKAQVRPRRRIKVSA